MKRTSIVSKVINITKNISATIRHLEEASRIYEEIGKNKSVIELYVALISDMIEKCKSKLSQGTIMSKLVLSILIVLIFLMSAFMLFFLLLKQGVKKIKKLLQRERCPTSL